MLTGPYPKVNIGMLSEDENLDLISFVHVEYKCLNAVLRHIY
jgi:hypothetical protein